MSVGPTPTVQTGVACIPGSAEAVEANAHERAADALEKAVTLDPEFIEAHGNLGVQYALLKQFEKAADEIPANDCD
jgi:hypothetical protein